MTGARLPGRWCRRICRSVVAAVPSVGVKPFALAPLVLVVSSLLGLVPGEAAAAGDAVPAHCVAHTTFSDGADLAGDYRCAGLAVAFHTAGASASPFPLWAGQWLFVDDTGQYRMGTCTFNRGTHPTVLVPSKPVAQFFPNDPGGLKAGYLLWRHGATTDPLVAAGLWAVLHHYTLDAAGSNRSADPAAPLVPRLDGLAAATGRADLQATALALDAEARAMSAPWTLQVHVDRTSGSVTATLLAGIRPVPGRSVTILVSGDDVSRSATTGMDGRATVAVPLPQGAVAVAVTSDAPGPVQVYRGSPAAPNPLGAQTLAVAGAPRVLRAVTSLDALPPTTTSPPTMSPPTMSPPTTEVQPATTTTATPETTTSPTTAPPTSLPVVPVTTTPPTTTPTDIPAIPGTTHEIAPTTTAPAPHPPLPTTGRGGDGVVAPLATAFLVGGIGLLGTLRRRGHTA